MENKEYTEEEKAEGIKRADEERMKLCAKIEAKYQEKKQKELDKYNDKVSKPAKKLTKAEKLSLYK